MASPEISGLRNIIQFYADSTGFPAYFVGDSINTIIFGEYHWAYQTSQDILIRLARPQKILLEVLGGFEYSPRTRLLTLQSGHSARGDEQSALWEYLSRYQQEGQLGLKTFKDISDDLNVPLIGCNLTIYEMDHLAFVKHARSGDDPEALARNTEKRANIVTRRTRKEVDRYMFNQVASNQGTLDNRTLVIIGLVHARFIHKQGLLSNYCYIEYASDTVRMLADRGKLP